MQNIPSIAAIIFLTLLSGWGDSQGFVHASQMWNNNKIIYHELIKTIIAFSFGIGTYLISIKYLQQVGVLSPETQTLGWLVATTVGVALASGKFIKWQQIDQILAIGVVILLGILIYRTNG